MMYLTWQGKNDSVHWDPVDPGLYSSEDYFFVCDVQSLKHEELTASTISDLQGVHSDHTTSSFQDKHVGLLK